MAALRSSSLPKGNFVVSRLALAASGPDRTLPHCRKATSVGRALPSPHPARRSGRRCWILNENLVRLFSGVRAWVISGDGVFGDSL